MTFGFGAACVNAYIETKSLNAKSPGFLGLENWGPSDNVWGFRADGLGL